MVPVLSALYTPYSQLLVKKSTKNHGSEIQKKNGFLFLAKFPSCSAEELDHAYMQIPAPTVSTGQSRLLCLVSTANRFPKWKQTQIFRFPWEVRWHVSNLNRCLRLVSSGLLSWALGRNWGIWITALPQTRSVLLKWLSHSPPLTALWLTLQSSPQEHQPGSFPVSQTHVTCSRKTGNGLQLLVGI